MVRAIDVAIEELTPIDEHGVIVERDQQGTWDALMPTVSRAFGGPIARYGARMLGCAEQTSSGSVDRIGSTVPAFVVARSVEPAMLALEGAHRYSRYALLFRIEPLAGGRSRLRAETRAEFPGWKGRIYRGLVLGTHGHVVVIGRILRAVKKRAERGR